MGNRLRVAATAEFSGCGCDHTPADFRDMTNVFRGLFPDGADCSKIEYWAGLRPMTPEGTPILGATRFSNLWLNTGQGHMGWAMSHGADRLVADMIASWKTAISMGELELDS
jgi:D-amino-acid dehydrogenase